MAIPPYFPPAPSFLNLLKPGIPNAQLVAMCLNEHDVISSKQHFEILIHSMCSGEMLFFCSVCHYIRILLWHETMFSSHVMIFLVEFTAQKPFGPSCRCQLRTSWCPFQCQLPAQIQVFIEKRPLKITIHTRGLSWRSQLNISNENRCEHVFALRMESALGFEINTLTARPPQRFIYKNDLTISETFIVTSSGS